MGIFGILTKNGGSLSSILAGTGITIVDNGNGTITISSGGANITVVANYSALPAANTVSGKFYWVSNSQGIPYTPDWFGGAYYPKGMYYSNGVTWEYTPSPFQATQAEVNTGTNTDKFVTPATLTSATVITNKATITQVQNSTTISATTTGTGSAYVAALTPALTSYVGTQIFRIKFHLSNAVTNPTLNIDTLGALTILKSDGTALGIGDIPINSIQLIGYDGTGLRLLGGGAVADASEIIKGVAELATDAETQTGSDDSRIVTPLKLANWWTNIKTLAFTFAAKITFTTSPRFNSIAGFNYLLVDNNKDLIGISISTLKSNLVLSKADVGLSAVDNTSDVNKPVSNAQGVININLQTQITAATQSIDDTAMQIFYSQNLI